MTKDAILSFLNIPYVWGGKNPLTGLDCSGLVEQILRQLGIDPPGNQNSQAFYTHFSTKGVGSILDFGALCFYGPSVSTINHIAFMINENQVIEAGGGGSATKTVEDAKLIGAFVRVRPFDHRKDLVAIIMPVYPDWVKTL
jgi:peptidoglycan DL-endopeptidase CwlO